MSGNKVLDWSALGSTWGGILKRSALTVALTCSSGTSWASGDDGFLENIYVPDNHVPAQELQIYLHDNLRIVGPGYWRIYQFIAYRAMTGHPLSKEEIDVFSIDGWSVGPRNNGVNKSDYLEATGIKTWLLARNAFTGATTDPADSQLDVTADAGEYASFINCNRDAFLRAAKTLAQRNTQYGKQWTATWLAGQDAVFANCGPKMPRSSGGKVQARPLTIPPMLPAKAPDWLTKDFAYQNASALFYAGRYDDARTRFLDIAKDAGSPWQPLGKYLAARCLIRKATLLPVPDNESPRSHPEGFTRLMTEARAELLSEASSFAPAKALIGWVDMFLRPDERRQELSARLTTEKINADTLQDLIDYLLFMDGLESTAKLNAHDDMTAWIGAMQAGWLTVRAFEGRGASEDVHKAALLVARSNWKKNHEVHWLAAVLQDARPLELNAEEIKAASAVKEDSAIYGIAQYSLARLNFALGKTSDVETITESMLAKPLAPSVRNRWLRVKLASASSADAFFAAAQRVVVDDTSEAPPTNEAKVNQTDFKYDDDLSRQLTHKFSLDALKRYRNRLPASEQSWLAEMIWTRAVLLGDYATADGVVDELVKGRDTTKHLYERYKRATSPAEKKDAALLILANTPELSPNVTGEAGDEGYAWRKWSCAPEIAPSDSIGTNYAPFMSQSDRTAAATELNALRKLPKRSAYLIPQVIEWAEKNLTDPEVPKALHFLVASTRNECGGGVDEQGGEAKRGQAPAHNYSRDAFQFLHTQYPKSEWTLKTKYYY